MDNNKGWKAAETKCLMVYTEGFNHIGLPGPQEINLKQLPRVCYVREYKQLEIMERHLACKSSLISVKILYFK